MNTQKDKFEKMFEEALREHEMPYDEQAWNAMNNKIVERGLRKSGYSAGLVAAATIGVVITVAASIFLLQDNDQQIVSIDIPTVSTTESTAHVEGGIDQNNFEANNGSSDANQNKIDENHIDNIDQGNNDENTNNVPHHEEMPSLPNDDLPLAADNSNNDKENDRIDPFDNSIVDRKEQNATNHVPTPEKDDIPVDVSVQVSAYEVCKGNSVLFSAEGSSEFKYEWIVDNQKMSGKEVTIPFHNPGNTEVQLEVLNDNKVVYNDSYTITVHAPVDAEIVVVPPVNKTFPEYEFKIDNAAQVKSVFWEVEETQSEKETVQHLFRKKGKYIITAEVLDFNGCRNKVHTDLSISDNFNLYAPDGINLSATEYHSRTFMPRALEVMNVPFKMMIYDRNSKLLYETSNVNQPWTGIDVSTNQVVPTGGYVWVVKLKKDGKEEVYFGSVTLVK